MADFDTDRARRAAERRRTWNISVARVCDTTLETGGTTPEARLAQMWPLAVDAWLMSGRPLPEYSRAEMPGVVIRRGECSD